MLANLRDVGVLGLESRQKQREGALEAGDRRVTVAGGDVDLAEPEQSDADVGVLGPERRLPDLESALVGDPRRGGATEAELRVGLVGQVTPTSGWRSPRVFSVIATLRSSCGS